MLLQHTPNARILVVGSTASKSCLNYKIPFRGSAGLELVAMLHEAGIARSSCSFASLAFDETDPDHLWWKPTKTEILPSTHVRFRNYFVDKRIVDSYNELQTFLLANPHNLVITLGDLPLFLFTGETSSYNYRGSLLESVSEFKQKLLPTFAPESIQANWEWRNICITDLRRAAAACDTPVLTLPPYNFTICNTFNHVRDALHHLIALVEANPTPLAVDIETIRHFMSCYGVATSAHDAFVFPVRTSREYWTMDEEIELVQLSRRLLSHTNAHVIGQNFLYDAQYFCRHWGVNPNVVGDTMLAQHVLFSGMSKDLAFLSSMYCDFHQYWKDELKDYRKAPDDDQKYFTYNAKDNVSTWEIHQKQLQLLARSNLSDQYAFQIQLFHACLDTMLRGVRIDLTSRNALAAQLMTDAQGLSDFITTVVGYELNPRSSSQMQKFLYSELGLKPVRNRKTKQITANFEALQKLANDFPLLWPIADALLDQRSIGVFLSTFVQAKLDTDNRMRCSFNPGGTETYRLSSSENAFGSGTNLQNIPKGDKKKGRYKLPNIRSLFVPDPGKTFFDVDLDRADLQVVVWEADDHELMEALRLGVDLHLYNGLALTGRSVPPLDELIEGHPKYADHRYPNESFRQLAKQFIHGTNYGGSARTMAITAGITTHQADQFQKRWFQMHPGIKRWHDRTKMQLASSRTVSNRFGYRRVYFGRVDAILPEALAWVPQSTVACVINRGWINLRNNLPDVEVLIQVHDSLAGQYPTADAARIKPLMKTNLEITIPYPRPLVIPVGLKTSTKSWGDCKSDTWD